jgi:hypothetical protein
MVLEKLTPTYLGVTFDRRLTWKEQINKICTRTKLRLSIMKKLTGTDWGTHQQTTKKLYIDRARPVMEYGVAAWATYMQSSQSKHGPCERLSKSSRVYHD